MRIWDSGKWRKVMKGLTVGEPRRRRNKTEEEQTCPKETCRG
jgi:hypothetical protein